MKLSENCNFFHLRQSLSALSSGLSAEYWAKPNSSNIVYNNSNSADSIDV